MWILLCTYSGVPDLGPQKLLDLETEYLGLVVKRKFNRSYEIKTLIIPSYRKTWNGVCVFGKKREPWLQHERKNWGFLCLHLLVTDSLKETMTRFLLPPLVLLSVPDIYRGKSCLLSLYIPRSTRSACCERTTQRERELIFGVLGRGVLYPSVPFFPQRMRWPLPAIQSS